MNKIGIFFGTDSGTTRLVAKKIARALGPELADKPLNVNRITLDDLLRYDVLILGTPSYGEGLLPGKATGVKDGSWQEFLPQLEQADLSGKLIAVYGLGDQDKYPQRFADALINLYTPLKNCGATLIGERSTEGYSFEQSQSVVDDKFVGLVIDHVYQGLLTDARIASWLDQIKPLMLEKTGHDSLVQGLAL
jgi:flavodoxin I